MKFSLFVGLLVPFVAAKVSYNGWKAYKIDTVHSHEAVTNSLKDFHHVSLGCGHSRGALEVAISPESLDAFRALDLNTTLLNDDLGVEIAEEGMFEAYNPTTKAQGLVAALPNKSYFKSYHNLEQHFQFLSDLHASLPNNSEIFSAGKSVQNRELRGIHLWGNGAQGKNPAIIWHGNVHAREWITAMGYKNNDALIRDTLDSYDFYIMPIVNPDGFVYTTKTDRLWRKNRQKYPRHSCIGTDINRNWPYKWDVPGGASEYPCDETYRGVEAGDTPENQALVNHTMTISKNTGIRSYVDWHSYSQLILLPYGYSCSAKANNLRTQMDVASGVADAIRKVHGLEFEYGPTCETIYQTSGESSDWVFDVAKAEFSWGIELRPRRLTGDGFVIPANQIVQSGEEIWAGMRYLFARL
ncbi:hypothetical protein NW762_014231 [Fusarium torreyae]|uniref:Peptidase M14 domain-containing protein n=1 Tax=Fusarium torreyae TaxID=1237075 RepID=A0A9W8V6S1_9HYPO|nr:hypothetical protein NW762_014231 [Fusarium torreyae]